MLTNIDPVIFCFTYMIISLQRYVAIKIKEIMMSSSSGI